MCDDAFGVSRFSDDLPLPFSAVTSDRAALDAGQYGRAVSMETSCQFRSVIFSLRKLRLWWRCAGAVHPDCH